jgi:hypothetical protein
MEKEIKKTNLTGKVIGVLGIGITLAGLGFVASYTCESFSDSYSQFTPEVWKGIYQFSGFFGSAGMIAQSLNYLGESLN